MARPSQKSAAAAPAMAVPATTRAARFFLAVLQFACPLLFFTNLTRNPYFTQIALLFIGIALCGVAWAVETFRRGEWRIPRLPFETPLLAFLAAAMICSLVSFGVHALLRPGLAFEMTRVWIFTIVNCVLALYLPLVFTTPLGGDGQPHRAITSDLVMAILWGAGWVAFAQMKTNDPSQTIWDPYGGFLWAIGLLYAIARTRHGDARSIFHVVFVVSFLAGAYGILQYAGHDIIWTSPVQPYGGRPVSTFGNPNFLSSYLMLACPLAIAFALRAQKAQRWGYAVVALVSGLGILSTLTRSTYVGLAAALLAMGAALFRREDLRFVKIATVALVAFVAFILLFPSTPVTHVQSPLARFTEIFEAMKTGQSYGPWHQRLLIWSSAWEMQKGFQLVGRGWGTFELFYPFFQGKFLLIPQLAQWRTHANNAHNVLLEFWSQTGLLGTGASVWVFVTATAAGWQLTRRHASDNVRPMAAALFGGMVGMVVDNFFGNVSIFFAVPAFLFWWNVGALFNEERPVRVWSAPVSDYLGRPVLILFIAGCLGAAGYYALRWSEECWYFIGFKQAKANNNDAAIDSLEKAFHWFPGDVNNNYELGNSLARRAHDLNQRGLKDEAERVSERAVRAYQTAINANPGYDEIYFNRAMSENQIGQKDKAVESLKLALFINPILEEAYGSLGTIYLSMGEFAKAADVFRDGTETFPKDKDLWNNLGYAYARQKNFTAAFDACKRAVEIDPLFQRAWQNMAEAAAAIGRRDPILEAPQLMDQLDKALGKKDFASALATAQKVEQIFPENADVHLTVGNLHFFLHDIPAAEKELNESLRLDPNFEPAWANLGRIHAFQQDYPKAREYFTKALQLKPDDAETKRQLEELPK